MNGDVVVQVTDIVKRKTRSCRLLYSYTINDMGYAVARIWLRYCATSRKVAGSIPDDVIGIFH